MPEPGVGAPPPAGRLDDRVLVALEERNGRLPFSALRRTLGAHPESLSRALHRLEREGLVERSSEGYRSARPPGPLTAGAAPLRSVARVVLPPGVESSAVLERLSGRWFGSLRWMGVVERPEHRLLAWARRDGTGTVLLGVEGGAVQIFATGDSAESEETESEAAAYEVLVAVAEALRPAPPRGSIRFLAARPPRPSPLSRLHSAAGPRLGNN